MPIRPFFVAILIASSNAAQAIPNPELIDSTHIAQAKKSSDHILRVQILELQIVNTHERNPKLQITAGGNVLSVLKSNSNIRVGDHIRLLYVIDEAGGTEAWREYRRKAEKEGYIGPAPPPGIPRVAAGDLVTVYAVDGNQDAILAPIDIVFEERNSPRKIAIGESVVLSPTEWATVQLAKSNENMDVHFLGRGRAHCPPGPNQQRGGLCSITRAQLLLNGRLIDFVHYPTTPPIKIVNGYSIEVLPSSTGQSDSSATLRVLDQNMWQQLWPETSQDSFSYGCGGGITGGYSRTEILRNGRITETSSPTFSGQRLSISVETGQQQLADQVFELLESIDFDKINRKAPRQSYSCSYKLRLGGSSANFLSSDKNPADIITALEEAQRMLTNKDQRVINSL